MRRLAILAVLPALAVLAAPDQAFVAGGTASGIVATFDVGGETFRAHIENPATIQQVIDLQNGQSTATIPIGALLPGEEYNTGWSWHTDPWDIAMAEVTIELCDGLPSHVEADLDYWLYTVGTYCPWGAVLIDVEYLAGPVGGIAEPPLLRPESLPGVADTSGPAPGAVAATAIVAAGAAMALGMAAWYARRRWLRR